MRILRPAFLVATAVALSGCADQDPLDLAPDTPVVMVVIDTLSARHLPWHGYELDTAPNLARLASHATVFLSNTTQCNSTFPSITSILTGLYPKTHKNLLAVPEEGTFDVGPSVPSLAERLGAAGYDAFAVASHPSWTAEPRTDAVRRGWRSFSVIPPGVSEPRALWANGAYTNERVFRALDEHERDPRGPLFLWAHYFDPHTDLDPLVYCPPPEWRDRFLAHHLERAGRPDLEAALAALEPVERTRLARSIPAGEGRRAVELANGRALYDAEIAYCDHEIGRLFERLRQMDLFDRALIVVMADHGENLVGRDTEDGSIAFTHRRLFEPVARTPLILKLPGQSEGRTIEALTQNIDVLPTILELLHLPPGPPVEGKSLVPLLANGDARIHDEVWIESSDNVEKAVRTDRWKYIDSDGERPEMLFAWRDDPLETRNRLAERPEVAGPLAEDLRAFRPKEVLRIHVAGAGAPRRVSIGLEMPSSAVKEARDASGRPVAGVSDDGQRFEWAATVGADPVDLVLLLKNRKPPVIWSLSVDGHAPERGSVYLGQVPVETTAAVPLFGGGAPAGAGPMDLRVDVRAGKAPGNSPTEAPGGGPGPAKAELLLEIGAGEGRRQVELRYREPAYKKTFELLASENLAEPEHGRAGVLVLTALGPGPAKARVALSAEDVLVLPRLDGTWPRPDRFAWNGELPPSEALRFLWPTPNDPRLNANLLAAPDLDRLPPGAIAIWRAGGGRVAFDPAHLDPARAAELRSLGYLGE